MYACRYTYMCTHMQLDSADIVISDSMTLHYVKPCSIARAGLMPPRRLLYSV